MARPKLLAVLAAAVAVAVAGGCSTLSGEPEPSGDTLEFWMYQPPTPQGAAVFDKVKADFEKEHNAKVNLVQIPKDDYNTKLATAMSGGGGPDAGYLDQPLVARFALDASIQEVPSGAIDEKAYFAGALDTNRVGGKLYGLPLDHTTVALFYNKSLIPTPPKTWDDLLKTSAAIHQANPEVAGISVPKGDGYGAWMWPAFVASAGGTMLDEQNKKVTFADQPGVDALTLWRNLLASSPRKITDAASSFQTGKAAMMISGPWDVSSIRDQFPDLDFGVAPLPYKDKPAGNIGGENVVVFKDAKNADLAWKWLTFLINETNGAAVADALGGYATNLKAAEAAAADADPIYDAFIEQLKVAQARPAVPQWIQINDEFIAPAIERGLSGEVTPEQALKEAADKTRSLLGWPAS